MKQFIYLLFAGLLCTGLKGYAQSNPCTEGLKGKRIAVIGDSYVRNHKEPVEYTWHYQFAERHGMQYYNFGRNGNCIAYSRARFGEAMYLRYTSMPDSLDYVVVIAGHNDTGLLDSIGGIETFRERMALLCEGLITRYPAAKLFFFTRWNCEKFRGSDAERVVDTMIEVCADYSIPIFDCARKSGIFASSEPFRRLYFQRPDDTAHLNAKGHERFLPCAAQFILQY